MTADEIPQQYLEKVSREAFREVAEHLAHPVVVIVDVDAGVRTRAIDAVKRVTPSIQIITAAGEQEALAAVSAHAAAALWMCESSAIDGRRIIRAARDRCALARVAVCAAAVPVTPTETWCLILAPEPPPVLPEQALLGFFPELVRAALAGWDRGRADLVRAEVARRLRAHYPAAALRACGYALPALPDPLPMEQTKINAAQQALQHCDFNKAAAARVLEISRTTLDGYCDPPRPAAAKQLATHRRRARRSRSSRT